VAFYQEGKDRPDRQRRKESQVSGSRGATTGQERGGKKDLQQAPNIDAGLKNEIKENVAEFKLDLPVEPRKEKKEL
jgi:hypothetical protein